MAHTLPELPYDLKALEPHISERTLSFHHGKHHQTYVDKLNELIAGTELADKELEDVIKEAHENPAKIVIFNNAAQVWNHTFYWNCMSPNGGGEPSDELKEKLDEAFGSFEHFKKEFKNACITQFGSGWAWLVEKDGALTIMKTPNADLPMVHDAKALLTCDVWEHAYYLDYQNKRPDYVDTFLENLVNWEFVESNLG